MRTNFHTHAKRCKHATGTERDYVETALEANIEILGFTDHGPFPDNRFSHRMDYAELADYLLEVNTLKQEYSDKICIKSGLEIEYDPREHTYYDTLLTKFDYLILGQHDYINAFNIAENVYTFSSTKDYIPYANSIVDAMKSGYFKLVAHPDLFFVNDFPWDTNTTKACETIILGAIKYNVPLEFNANGFRRGLTHFSTEIRYQYPHHRFWAIASTYQPPVVINSDCHAPEQIWDYAMDLAHEVAQFMGLRIINNIFI